MLERAALCPPTPNTSNTATLTYRLECATREFHISQFITNPNLGYANINFFMSKSNAFCKPFSTITNNTYTHFVETAANKLF